MARGKVYITGIPKVLRNLNKEILKIRGRSMVGLIRGVIIIRRDMERTPPLIPVDWGNLRASWFVISGIGGNQKRGSSTFKGPQAAKLSSDHQTVSSNVGATVAGQLVVGFGFSAHYSGYIHETTKPFNWKRTGSGRKFLEASIERNKLAVLTVIKDTAKPT